MEEAPPVQDSHPEIIFETPEAQETWNKAINFIEFKITNPLLAYTESNKERIFKSNPIKIPASGTDLGFCLAIQPYAMWVQRTEFIGIYLYRVINLFIIHLCLVDSI